MKEDEEGRSLKLPNLRTRDGGAAGRDASSTDALTPAAPLSLSSSPPWLLLAVPLDSPTARVGRGVEAALSSPPPPTLEEPNRLTGDTRWGGEETPAPLSATTVESDIVEEVDCMAVLEGIESVVAEETAVPRAVRLEKERRGEGGGGGRKMEEVGHPLPPPIPSSKKKPLEPDKRSWEMSVAARSRP